MNNLSIGETFLATLPAFFLVALIKELIERRQRKVNGKNGAPSVQPTPSTDQENQTLKTESTTDDLKVECSHCGQHLDVPREMLGETVACPMCNEIIQLPGQPPPPSPTSPVNINRYESQSSANKQPQPKIRYGATIRDVLIVWTLTGIGGALFQMADGTSFPTSFTSSTTMAIANIFLGTVAFVIIGCLAGEHRWKHMYNVAVLTWITYGVGFTFGLTPDQWFFSIIQLSISTILGGLISLVFRRPSKDAIGSSPGQQDLCTSQMQSPETEKKVFPQNIAMPRWVAGSLWGVMAVISGVILIYVLLKVSLPPSLGERIEGCWHENSRNFIIKYGTLAFRETGRVYASYQVLDNETLRYRCGHVDWIVKVAFPTSTTMVWYRGQTDKPNKWMSFQKMNEQEVEGKYDAFADVRPGYDAFADVRTPAALQPKPTTAAGAFADLRPGDDDLAKYRHLENDDFAKYRSGAAVQPNSTTAASVGNGRMKHFEGLGEQPKLTNTSDASKPDFYDYVDFMWDSDDWVEVCTNDFLSEAMYGKIKTGSALWYKDDEGRRFVVKADKETSFLAEGRSRARNMSRVKLWCEKKGNERLLLYKQEDDGSYEDVPESSKERFCAEVTRQGIRFWRVYEKRTGEKILHFAGDCNRSFYIAESDVPEFLTEAHWRNIRVWREQ